MSARVWWRERREELLELAAGTTPLYVYDEGALLDAVQALRGITAISRLFYAVKANPHAGVLRVLHAAELGFECVSWGEIRHVLGLFPDLDRERVLFTPNFAPRVEYERALAAGVRVTLDNVYPLGAWPDLFRRRDLLVRLDPGLGAGHHPFVRTAGPQSKFGIAPEELALVERLAGTVGARIVGLHAHVGSGILAPQTWLDVARFLASRAAGLPDLRVLNLGGGLGVPEEDAAAELDLPTLAAGLARCRVEHPDFELWLEPGRFVVAAAGVLLTRVTQLKTKDGRHYVGVDVGMNSLLRPALYGARHAIVNLTRLYAPPAITAEIVGPICEAADVLGSARALPASEEGDVLLVAAAGAYGAAMASRYNLREPAAELLLARR